MLGAGAGAGRVSMTHWDGWKLVAKSSDSSTLASSPIGCVITQSLSFQLVKQG